MTRRPVLLLVDDEARILSALQRTLRREGYEILTAETVAAAEQHLEMRRVDVVLTDQKMPGTSGLEFLARVRDRNPDTARLLITGWPDDVGAGVARALGVRAILPKPWVDADLKAALRDALAT